MHNGETVFLVPHYNNQKKVLRKCNWLLKGQYGWDVYDDEMFNFVFEPVPEAGQEEAP